MSNLLIMHNVKIALFCLIFCIIIAISSLKFAGLMFDIDCEKYRKAWKSFLVIVILFSIAFSINVLCAFLFIMLISYLALKEFLSLIPIRKTDRRVIFWAYMTIPIQFYFIYKHWITMFYLFIPLYAYLFLAIRMVISSNTNGFLKSFATIHTGLMITVYAIGYIALILCIPNDVNPVAGSVGLLFFILVVNIFNDFFQMITGKFLGSHKILPKVSPNKTWEGFVGGIICTTIMVVLLAPYLTPMTFNQSVFIGIILSIAGFCGDVFMSALKRDMGVKDTSSMLPGHGGILDRLDSLIFNAPLFFHFIAFTNHIVITGV